MGLGIISPDLVTPITGSDRITQGFTSALMHIDPSTGLSYTTEAAQAQAAADAAAQQASVPATNWALWIAVIAALAAGGWYAYKEGWFDNL